MRVRDAFDNLREYGSAVGSRLEGTSMLCLGTLYAKAQTLKFYGGLKSFETFQSHPLIEL